MSILKNFFFACKMKKSMPLDVMFYSLSINFSHPRMISFFFVEKVHCSKVFAFNFFFVSNFKHMAIVIGITFIGNEILHWLLQDYYWLPYFFGNNVELESKIYCFCVQNVRHIGQKKKFIQQINMIIMMIMIMMMTTTLSSSSIIIC